MHRSGSVTTTVPRNKATLKLNDISQSVFRGNNSITAGPGTPEQINLASFRLMQTLTNLSIMVETSCIDELHHDRSQKQALKLDEFQKSIFCSDNSVTTRASMPEQIHLAPFRLTQALTHLSVVVQNSCVNYSPQPFPETCTDTALSICGGNNAVTVNQILLEVCMLASAMSLLTLTNPLIMCQINYNNSKDQKQGAKEPG